MKLMREIKAAGSEAFSGFIFVGLVGKLIDYLLLFLSSLRKLGGGQHAAHAFCCALKMPKWVQFPGWVYLF